MRTNKMSVNNPNRVAEIAEVTFYSLVEAHEITSPAIGHPRSDEVVSQEAATLSKNAYIYAKALATEETGWLEGSISAKERREYFDLLEKKNHYNDRSSIFFWLAFAFFVLYALTATLVDGYFFVLPLLGGIVSFGIDKYYEKKYRDARNKIFDLETGV